MYFSGIFSFPRAQWRQGVKKSVLQRGWPSPWHHGKLYVCRHFAFYSLLMSWRILFTVHSPRGVCSVHLWLILPSSGKRKRRALSPSLPQCELVHEVANWTSCCTLSPTSNSISNYSSIQVKAVSKSYLQRSQEPVGSMNLSSDIGTIISMRRKKELQARQEEEEEETACLDWSMAARWMRSKNARRSIEKERQVLAKRKREWKRVGKENSWKK